MILETIEKQSYQVYTVEEIQTELFALSKKIRKTGKTYDRIVALARGGVSVAQTIADLLGIKHISVIQSELYTSIGEKNDTPIITQPLAANVKGEHILLVDDLVDSGETLLFAKNYLHAHGPLSVDCATLSYKPATKCMPDFTGQETKAWIIFPWETRETIQTLTDMWGKAAIHEEKIRQNLTRLGFSKDQIETFWKN